MSVRTADLAAIANDAYREQPSGRWSSLDAERVMLNGNQYKILEHVDNRINGYQGTIYQRVDTGDLVVGHRGTEQLGRDGALTDMGMVVVRINHQAADAVSLTGRAIQLADDIGRAEGRSPSVSVTGHSLGGALTQITAHHFDLKGETFNAYGAASLSRRIPEGGHAVINHATATDPVSAASPHYGEMRLYATPKEIATLKHSGYGDDLRLSNYLEPPLMRPVRTAAVSVGAHSMSNFIGLDSVLEDSRYRELATANREMIEDYRGDLNRIRQGSTLMMRSGVGAAMDLVDEMRGPLPAGEPARREAEPRPMTPLPPLPQDRPLPSFRSSSPTSSLEHADHPGHSLYLDALRGVSEQDRRVGRTSDVQSEQLASSLAAEMHALGGKRIDHVVMSQNAETTFAVQGELADPAHLRASVPTIEGMNTSLAQSGHRIEEQAASQQLAQQLSDPQQVLQASPTMRA